MNSLRTATPITYWFERENRLYVRIEDDNAGLVDVYGTQRLTEDEWVHVAVVQDGHALRIYLNGELDGLEDGATAGTWTSHLNLAMVDCALALAVGGLYR